VRYRRLLKRLFLIAGVLCVLSLAYLGYGWRRASQLEAACKAAQDSRQWAQLEIHATEWARWRPDRALPWLYAAEAANQQGDAIRTATYLYYLPDGDPLTPAGLLELSHLQFGVLNQPIAAAETCRRILRLQPDHSEAHRRLIFYYAMSRQRAPMIAEARRAIEAGCDAPETYLYLFGADWMTFANGYELNQRWLQSAPDYEPFLVARAWHLLHTQALIAESEDDASRIAKVMADLLERFPQNEELLAYHIGLACFRGERTRVAELLAQAPPSSVSDSRFWRFKGWMHADRGELGEAEKAYLHALELYPFDWQAQHDLAALYRRKEEYQQVAKFQEAAILGKKIMQQSLQSPDTESLSDQLLSNMIRYARTCGQLAVAEQFEARVRVQGRPTPAETPVNGRS
jgi:tetratricopeptide (TPR) repeat protein